MRDGVKISDLSSCLMFSAKENFNFSLEYYMTRINSKEIDIYIMIYNKTQKSGELFFKTMGENPLNFDTPPEIESWGRISYPKVTFSDEEVIEKTAELYRKAYKEIQKFLG